VTSSGIRRPVDVHEGRARQPRDAVEPREAQASVGAVSRSSLRADPSITTPALLRISFLASGSEAREASSAKVLEGDATPVPLSGGVVAAVA
jgi:hypothetical protein